jgi:hypothetical protein
MRPLTAAKQAAGATSPALIKTGTGYDSHNSKSGCLCGRVFLYLFRHPGGNRLCLLVDDFCSFGFAVGHHGLKYRTKQKEETNTEDRYRHQSSDADNRVDDSSNYSTPHEKIDWR